MGGAPSAVNVQHPNAQISHLFLPPHVRTPENSIFLPDRPNGPIGREHMQGCLSSPAYAGALWEGRSAFTDSSDSSIDTRVPANNRAAVLLRKIISSPAFAALARVGSIFKHRH